MILEPCICVDEQHTRLWPPVEPEFDGDPALPIWCLLLYDGEEDEVVAHVLDGLTYQQAENLGQSMINGA